MYKMHIKLNNALMKIHGLEAKSSELSSLISNINSYSIDSVSSDADGNTIHNISTNKFGDESYLITLLEELPWFMKYVLEWTTDDNGLFSDMIEVEHEMGLMCAYGV